MGRSQRTCATCKNSEGHFKESEEDGERGSRGGLIFQLEMRMEWGVSKEEDREKESSVLNKQGARIGV